LRLLVEIIGVLVEGFCDIFKNVAHLDDSYLFILKLSYFYLIVNRLRVFLAAVKIYALLVQRFYTDIQAIGNIGNGITALRYLLNRFFFKCFC
jgi:hypothetical protein